MKRILLILVLAGIMAMSLQAGSVAAELEEITTGEITDESVLADDAVGEIVDSGECGTNVTYVRYSDGTLVISGTGAIKDRAFRWDETIKKVIIENGVTGIGTEAFNQCTGIVDIQIPSSVTSISDALCGCSSLTSINLPDSITSLDS